MSAKNGQVLAKLVHWLVSNGYAVQADEDFFLTTKAYNDLDRTLLESLLGTPVKPLQQIMPKPFVKTDKKSIEAEWKSRYLQFIAECKIPRRMQSGSGELYDVNQYSEEGMKAFRKMLEDELVDYSLLVKTTNLYYHSPGYKQKVGNYISQGTWRTDYAALSHAVESEKADEYIKRESHAKNLGKFRLG